MHNATSHLSPAPEGATLLAWHSTEDVQAVRLCDGSQSLMLAGRAIPLTARHGHATQQVINYCHCNKREAAKLRRAWEALAANA